MDTHQTTTADKLKIVDIKLVTIEQKNLLLMIKAYKTMGNYYSPTKNCEKKQKQKTKKTQQNKKITKGQKELTVRKK